MPNRRTIPLPDKLLCIPLQDYIDIALVILREMENRDVIDFYLGILYDNKITARDLADYEKWSDDEYVGDDLNKLESILRELGKWE